MNSATNLLALESLKRIDAWCGQFEAAEPTNRRLDDFLERATPPERPILLRELVALDVELRSLDGQHPRTAVYRQAVQDHGIEIDPDELERLIQAKGGSSPTQPSADRYRFIERIGRGGNGEVWRVDDTVSQRPLALKVLRFPTRHDDAATERMNREALLTGRLQHPGIPPIYDHGRLDDGRPFFTMKLVDGETYDSILKRRTADANREDLTRCLGVFEQLAQTVAYAHSQGVIHRDLKPENVMVGAFGEVQVMDWGMAKPISQDAGESERREQDQRAGQKETDYQREAGNVPSIQEGDTARQTDDESWDDLRRSLTAAGDVLGTPAYMSPEQARGEIKTLGPTSDVFTLGAILFEILTGERLHRGISVAQALHRTATGQLSESLARLHADAGPEELIRLCQWCLKADPISRPADAGVVATAVTDHLAGVERRARQAEMDRREAAVMAGEERKRRQLQTRTAVFVVAVSLVGTAVALWQWRQAANASRRAAEAVTLADKRFAQARSVVDEYLTEVADENGILARTPDTQAVRRSLLEKARRYYIDFLDQAGDDPDVRHRAAEAHARLADIAFVIDPGGRDTVMHYHKVIELYDSLLDIDDSRLPFWRGKADAIRDLARTRTMIQRYEEATDLFRECIAVYETLVALDDRPAHQIALADGLRGLGNALSRLGRRDEAEPHLMSAVQIADRVMSEVDQDAEHLAKLSLIYNNAGTHFGFRRGNWERCHQYYRNACELGERLVRAEPEFPNHRRDWAGRLMNLGISLHVLKRYDESHAALLQAASISETIERENPSVADFTVQVAMSHENLGTFSIKQSLHDEAVNHFAKAADAFRRLVIDHPRIRSHQTTLAKTLGQFAFVMARRDERGERPSPDPRIAAVVEEIIRIYQSLAQQDPESIVFPAKQALWMSLSPQAPVDDLIDLTRRVASDPKATLAQDTDAVAGYAMALIRSGRDKEAADMLDQLDSRAWREVMWLTHGLAHGRSEPRIAKDSLAKAEKRIARMDPPHYTALVLRDEVRALVQKD